VVLVLGVLSLLLIDAIAVSLLIVLKRIERAHYGRSLPGHLRPMRWANQHPWRWAASIALPLGLLSLVLSRHPVRAVIVGLVLFAVVGLNGRYGLGRWWSGRRLARFETDT
jgi:uncharacterized membrane protein